MGEVYRARGLETDESGEKFVHAISFPELTKKIPVAAADGALWSADGARLVLLSRSRSIRTVEISDTAAAREIAHIENRRRVRVDPLGRGMIVVDQRPGTGTVTELQLAQGWFEELGALLPAR